MLIQINDSSLQPVKNLENGKTIAYLKNAVFDPKLGKMLGIVIKTGIFSQDKIIPAKDLQLSSDLIGITNIDDIVNEDEIIKIKNILKKKYRVLSQHVREKSGRYLGTVEGVLIESEGFNIVKLYVSKISFFGTLLRFLPNIGEGLVISREQVLKITPKAIIVKNGVKKEVVAEKDLKTIKAESAK